MRLLQASLAGYTFFRRCCGRCFCSFSGNQSHIRSTGLVTRQPGKEESKEKFVLAVNPELHQTGTIITEKLKSICRSSRTCAQTSFSIAFANVNKKSSGRHFFSRCTSSSTQTSRRELQPGRQPGVSVWQICLSMF